MKEIYQNRWHLIFIISHLPSIFVRIYCTLHFLILLHIYYTFIIMQEIYLIFWKIIFVIYSIYSWKKKWIRSSGKPRATKPDILDWSRTINRICKFRTLGIPIIFLSSEVLNSNIQSSFYANHHLLYLHHLRSNTASIPYDPGRQLISLHYLTTKFTMLAFYTY